MPSLEAYLVTFNCAREPVNPDTLAPHLFDALPQDAGLPDVVAIALQEVAPIAYSFLGGSYLEPYFSQVASTVQLAAKLHSDDAQAYQHFLTRSLGMTALMLFWKPAVASKIQWVQSAGAGVGLWDMGNKGAVGVRVGLALDNSDETFDITFVSGHLAPMEGEVPRRNQDWENIVRNLVFINDETPKSSAEEQPLLSSPSAPPPPDNTGLYHPSNHIFVAGDLNYRTHDTPPDPNSHINYPQPTPSSASPTHFSHFLKTDQLARELDANRTLHGFSEAPITFPPTYKHSPKPDSSSDADEQWQWAKHRYPSWCDRILFLPPLRPHIYTSLALQKTSDHQPVALSVSVSLDPPNRVYDAEPPFPLNKDWRARADAARRKEIVVGVLSYLALTRSGNAVLVGVVAVVVAGVWMAGWMSEGGG
ncbi:DNase I-like protein [Mytilinidion resinicola]|uniref:DNase I-like protein n=1 Tax=Mytilinidion resinicola TaxID=574789 RepID=A0A6A6Y4Z8_9PEZI|nr:DNase I-like protein [Mytilinidion resinicola]KAF2803305.1 DNase I-like protein [Mytilinidion resinicola]